MDKLKAKALEEELKRERERGCKQSRDNADEREDIERLLRAAKRGLAEKDEELKELQSTVDKLKQSHDELKSASLSLENSVIVLKKESEERENTVNLLKKELDEMKTNTKKLDDELTFAKDESDRANEMGSIARRRAEELQQKNNDLKEKATELTEKILCREKEFENEINEKEMKDLKYYANLVKMTVNDVENSLNDGNVGDSRKRVEELRDRMHELETNVARLDTMLSYQKRIHIREILRAHREKMEMYATAKADRRRHETERAAQSEMMMKMTTDQHAYVFDLLQKYNQRDFRRCRHDLEVLSATKYNEELPPLQHIQTKMKETIQEIGRYILDLSDMHKDGVKVGARALMDFAREFVSEALKCRELRDKEYNLMKKIFAIEGKCAAFERRVRRNILNADDDILKEIEGMFHDIKNMLDDLQFEKKPIEKMIERNCIAFLESVELMHLRQRDGEALENAEDPQ